MSALVIIGLALFGYSLISKRLSTTIISAPMVFVTIGVISTSLGNLGKTDARYLGIAVEVTLALLLFTDAARIDLASLRRWSSYPARLLGIGLPLTVLAGTAVALLVFKNLVLAEAILLAAAVAPTDAALGEAVVEDKRLPVRIRQGLNVESGLNDGIAVPIVTVALAVAAADLGEGGFVSVALKQVGFGVLVGAGVSAIGTLALLACMKRGWVTNTYRQIGLAGLIFTTYAIAVYVGGSGFIACFVGGMVFGALMRQQGAETETFASEEGAMLSNVTFLLFGAVMVPVAWGRINAATIIFVILALTVVRIVPVWIAMLGTKTLPETKLFMGWFGPRGLASILFALQIGDELVGPSADAIITAIVITILVSVYAHGMTANPWVAHLARRLRRQDDSISELKPVATVSPTRLGVAKPA